MKRDPKLTRSIGKRIKQVRDSQGMTQAQVAFEMNITIKHLSSVERGISRFSYEHMINFCKVMDTSIDYIITGRSPLGDDIHIPQSIVETLRSNNESIRQPLIEYLNLYEKLHQK